MTQPSPEPTALDGITIVIPVQNRGTTLHAIVTDWMIGMADLGREIDWVIVDDGSTDNTAMVLDALRAEHPLLTVHRHPLPQGYGACLRTALPTATRPLFFYTSLDYPYTPSDLKLLLKQIETKVEMIEGDKLVDAVSGVRTGRPQPGIWKFAGNAYRLFCRIVLGSAPERISGWLGFRNHFRSWWAWLLMGVPLTDVNSAFKLIRRPLLDRFPLQSDGDFVHAEIFAKLTFLSCLVAEVPLSPKLDVVSPTNWSEFAIVLKDAQFHPAIPVTL